MWKVVCKLKPLFSCLLFLLLLFSIGRYSSTYLGSKEQASLLPSWKDLSSPSSAILCCHTPHCVCRCHGALITLPHGNLGSVNHAKCWYSSCCHCCKKLSFVTGLLCSASIHGTVTSQLVSLPLGGGKGKETDFSPERILAQCPTSKTMRLKFFSCLKDTKFAVIC